ncbi:MAG: hypothetical protein Q8Q08_12365 [Candidatus Omnitrophota bacterium]|nr:hypothetical protein [Candidatus Omnitrophota bacterium]MDZ4241317.1 hypothetical protein [Candidatus Omnitrophota bacterium]
MGDFRQVVAKLNQDYAAAVKLDTGDAYSRLSTIFGGLEQAFREHMQSLTEKDLKRVIQKLKGGETLTVQDLEVVKLWMVGDADYYTTMENNLQDWKNELKRIMEEISLLNAGNLDLAGTCRMRGLLTDGSRVIGDVFYYAQQKDRMAKFLESTKEIDPEERAILVRLLEQKIKSDIF